MGNSLNNKIIIQSNTLSRANYKFSYNQRIFLLAIQSKIKTNEEAKTNFTITMEDIHKVKNKAAASNELKLFNKEGLKSFLEMNVLFISKTEKTAYGVTLFQEITKEEDVIHVVLNPKFAVFLYPYHKFNGDIELYRRNFDNKYTKLVASSLVKLKRVVALKLYETLSSYYRGGDVYFEINHLRIILGVSKIQEQKIEDDFFMFSYKNIIHTKYVETKKFTVILKQAVQDINSLEKNSLNNIKNLSLIVVKKKKKIIGYTFNYFNRNGVQNTYVEHIVNTFKLRKTQATNILSSFSNGNSEKEALDIFIKWVNSKIKIVNGKNFSKRTGNEIQSLPGFVWGLLQEEGFV